MRDPNTIEKDTTRRGEDGGGVGVITATLEASHIRPNPLIAIADGSPARRTQSLAEIYNTCTLVLHVAEPVEFKEAVKLTEWEKAMDAEMASIKSNNIWELWHLPPRKHALGLMWICKSKCNAEDQVVRQKSRLMAKGYSQKFSINSKRCSRPLLVLKL